MKNWNLLHRCSQLRGGLLWFALALVLSGCGRGSEADHSNGSGADSLSEHSGDADASEDEDQDEAVPVDVAVLGHGSIEAIIRASANLEAELAVRVLSEAMRRIVELHVEEGDRVRKGTLLLRLQDDEQRSALARAKTEHAKAQREFDRQKRLHERELTTDQALNDATDELERGKLALDDAQRELSYTEVRASIAGTISSRMVNLGDHVQLGQHLFDIVDFESIVARIFVPEKNLKQLRPDLPARVHASAVRDEPFEGRVKRISPVVDPRTGTVKVTVDVGGRSELRPGLYVDVELVTDVHEDAILVPKRALVYDNDQVFIYRLQPDHTVARLRVVPRLADRDWVEPVGGVAVGDSVIIAGQAGLKHGARVRLPEIETADTEQVDAALPDDAAAAARVKQEGDAP